MVTYIRVVTVKQEADEESADRFRDLWESNDRQGLPPPVRSLPIKLWALLHEGPRSAEEIAWKLNCAVKSAYVAVQRLRDEGQAIVNQRGGHGPGRYCLLEGPPLKVVENRDGIRLPRRGARRCRNEVIIELK